MKKLTKTYKNLCGDFERLARTMSSHNDVEVVPGGKCRTNGRVIEYPVNADYFQTATKRLLHGLLDHEIGHIVEEDEHKKSRQKTPLTIVKENCMEDKTLKCIFNALEDVRMEKRWKQKYIGVAENLHEVSVWGAKRAQEIYLKDPKASWYIIGSSLMFEILGKEELVPEEVKPIMDIIREEIEEAKDPERMKWGWDSYQIALSIVTKIREEDSEEDNKEDSEGEDGLKGLTDDSEEPSEGEALEEEDEEKDDEKGDSEGAGGDGEDVEDDGEDDGEGDGDSDEGSGEDTEDGDGDDDSGEDDSGDGEGDEKDDAGDKEDSSESETKRLLKKLKASEVGCDDLQDLLKGEIEKEAEEEISKSSRYKIHPSMSELDRFVYAKDDNFVYKKAKEDVGQIIKGLKRSLLNLAKTRALDIILGDRTEGDLDGDVLATIPMGNKRVYTGTIEGEALDTAIMILLDFSGSMRSCSVKNHCAYYAQRMTISLSEPLDSLGIPFCVWGFHNPFIFGDGEATKRISSSDREDLTMRTERLEIILLKTFREKYKRICSRFGDMSGRENNTDGDAVLLAAKHLAQRPENRKILIVVSDGSPMGGGVNGDVLNKHLKEIVTLVTKSGIEVLGIGAGTNSVEKFYNKETGAENLVVKDFKKLTVDVFKVFRRMLLKKRKTS